MSTRPGQNRAPFSLGEVATITGGAIAAGKGDLRTEGVSTDSRTLLPASLFVALTGESFDGARFVGAAAAAGAGAAVVPRGFSPSQPLPEGFGLVEVDDPLRALGALARTHRDRFRELRVGAVTGSNGKTTTKELAASILEAAFGRTLKTEGNLNNEVGLPLTLLQLDEGHRAACVELGMSHFGEIARLTATARPGAGLVTCAQGVHLEGLGSVEGVARAKGELFHGLGPEGVAVANADDPLTFAQAEGAGRRILSFGRAGADVTLRRILSHDRSGLRFEVRLAGEDHAVRIPLVGLHNAMNACAAMALGLALGAAPSAILEGIGEARGFSRRLELKEAPGGITVLDDCYNGNPDSAEAALRTARELAGAGRVLAVLGDLRELGDREKEGHERVGAVAAEVGVDSLVAFGPRSASTAGAARRGGVPSILETEDPEEALRWLRASVREGDLVLFKASRGTRLERIADPLVEGR